jgi:hypothetical protein
MRVVDVSSLSKANIERAMESVVWVEQGNSIDKYAFY